MSSAKSTKHRQLDWYQQELIPESQATIRLPQAGPTLGVLEHLQRMRCLYPDVHKWLDNLVSSDKNEKLQVPSQRRAAETGNGLWDLHFHWITWLSREGKKTTTVRKSKGRSNWDEDINLDTGPPSPPVTMANSIINKQTLSNFR